MKHLKRLTLRLFRSDSATTCRSMFLIDDIGLYFGLISMPRLARLELTGNFTISEDRVAELGKYHYSVIIDYFEIPRKCKRGSLGINR